MVAELKVELEQMRSRLEQAERQLQEQTSTVDSVVKEQSDLQDLVDQNRQTHQTKLEATEEQVRKVEINMTELEDSIAPRCKF